VRLSAPVPNIETQSAAHTPVPEAAGDDAAGGSPSSAGAVLGGCDEASPRLPIELAIAEDALEHEAREFISELVDVRSELRELIEAAE